MRRFPGIKDSIQVESLFIHPLPWAPPHHLHPCGECRAIKSLSSKSENVGLRHGCKWSPSVFSVWAPSSGAAAAQRSAKQIRWRRIKIWWVQLFAHDAMAWKKEGEGGGGGFVSVDHFEWTHSEATMLVASGPKGGHSAARGFISTCVWPSLYPPAR